MDNYDGELEYLRDHAKRQLIHDKMQAAHEFREKLIAFQGGEELRCFICGYQFSYLDDADMQEHLEQMLFARGLTNNLRSFTPPEMSTGLRIAEESHLAFEHDLKFTESFNGSSPDYRMMDLRMWCEVEPALSSSDQCCRVLRNGWRCGARVDRSVSSTYCRLHWGNANA